VKIIENRPEVAAYFAKFVSGGYLASFYFYLGKTIEEGERGAIKQKAA